jgi:hypothetical protein
MQAWKINTEKKATSRKDQAADFENTGSDIIPQTN